MRLATLVLLFTIIPVKFLLAENNEFARVPIPALRPLQTIIIETPAPPFDPVKTREMCRAALGSDVADYTPIEPISEPNGCGNKYPITLASIGSPAVILEPKGITNCAMIGAFSTWLAEVVQPVALIYFDERITAFKNAASYVCRSRNNQPGAKMSEHAFMNALDISAFQLASGTWVPVAGNWEIDSVESQFLKAIHRGACAHFTTVLGPNANDLHSDHFHLDLGKHGQAGTYRVCE